MKQENLVLVQGAKGMELPFETGNWVLLKGEEGYSPVETLAACVGACGAYVYQSILKNSKIDYQFEKVHVTYKRDETKKSEPLSMVSLVFDIRVAEEDQGKAERGLKMIGAHCPVMQSLDPTIEISEIVNFL